MANMREMISMGISLAVAVLAAVMGAFVCISLPLLVLAVLLFAWALEPKRTEAFVGRLPYSNYLLKALVKLDLVLPGHAGHSREASGTFSEACTAYLRILSRIGASAFGHLRRAALRSIRSH
jgi:hypothetical protein